MSLRMVQKSKPAWMRSMAMCPGSPWMHRSCCSFQPLAQVHTHAHTTHVHTTYICVCTHTKHARICAHRDTCTNTHTNAHTQPHTTHPRAGRISAVYQALELPRGCRRGEPPEAFAAPSVAVEICFPLSHLSASHLLSRSDYAPFCQEH